MKREACKRHACVNALTRHLLPTSLTWSSISIHCPLGVQPHHHLLAFAAGNAESTMHLSSNNSKLNKPASHTNTAPVSTLCSPLPAFDQIEQVPLYIQKTEVYVCCRFCHRPESDGSCSGTESDMGTCVCDCCHCQQLQSGHAYLLFSASHPHSGSYVGRLWRHPERSS